MTIEDVIRTTPMPLSRKLAINLMYTANWVNELLTEALKPYDVSLQQFNVLRILQGQKGMPANLSTVQERMVNKMSNTTRLVDKLERKQLVVRVICPTNRRKIDISITPSGLKLLKEINNVIDSKEQEISKNIKPNEIEQLNTMLNNLRNNNK